MQRVCQIIIAFYALLCLAALLIIPLNVYGAFGMEPDPLSGIYAVLLAAPWSFFASNLAGDGAISNLFFMAAGMAINIAMLMLLCGRFRRRAS